MKFGRRTLLKFAPLAVVSAHPQAFASEPTSAQYDVIIVGGGGAGLSAAAHLAAGGKKVLLLEKSRELGGSTKIASGQWAASGTKLQKLLGIEDSEELFVKDMMEVGEGFNSEALVRSFVAQSSKELAWIEDRGITPSSIMANAGMSVPRAHFFNPEDLINVYRTECDKLGVWIETETPVVRLEKNSDGIVDAVIIKKGGNETKIRAKDGIVLATGGFGRNVRMLRKYSPTSSKATPLCAEGCTGDGIILAQALGADLDNMSFVKPTYGFLTYPTNLDAKSSSFYAGGIVVNQEGFRFVRENASYKEIGEAALQQSDGKSFIILDERARKLALRTDPREKNYMSDPADVKHGFSANNLKDLAVKSRINPDNLIRTVNQYNETAPNGTDSLGRDTLTFKFGKPFALLTPPFIALPATSALLTTYCGLCINEKMQVLDVFEKPIPGLYAIGEIAAGIHGKNAMSGSGFAKAFCMGSLVAKSLLNETNANP